MVTVLVVTTHCAPERNADAPAVRSPAAVPATVDDESPPSSPPGRTQASPPSTCDVEFPPIDLAGANIATTEASGIAEVISGRVTGPDGTAPPPDRGYVAVEYRVRLVRALNHREAPNEFTVTQTAEAPTEARAPGSLLLYSGCVDDAGVYEPDVAYFMWFGAGCRERLERFATRALGAPDPGGESPCSDR